MRVSTGGQELGYQQEVLDPEPLSSSPRSAGQMAYEAEDGLRREYKGREGRSQSRMTVRKRMKGLQLGT